MFQRKKPHLARSGRGLRIGPILSVTLILCYLAVFAWFLAYGSKDSQEPEADAENPVTVIFPETSNEPSPEVVFMEPFQEPIVDMPPPVKVKGLYVSAWSADMPKSLARYIELCETTEINALVIDIKDDLGNITFLTETEELSAVSIPIIKDMEGLISNLKASGIYTIARLVCFKDPIWSGRNPDMAVQDRWGGIWFDSKNVSWLDPYKKASWDYIADVCLEAARLGFDEIQLDYVRFPADGRLSDIDYGAAGEEKSKPQIIGEFMAYIRETLAREGVRLSADVFGIIAISDSDAADIGQDLGVMLTTADAISPMIYPSHFANKKQNGVGQRINEALFEAPDLQPYDVVYNILIATKRHLDSEGENAVIRPYLQDFTAAYLTEGYYQVYTNQQVREQIQAVYDAGFDEWILWNHSSVYTYDALPAVEELLLEGE